MRESYSMKEWLNNIADKIPVIWDRFIKTTKTTYKVYGWIYRSDGNRDFVLISVDFTDQDDPDIQCVTSSAKYSKELGIIIFGEDSEHIDCIKFDQFPE